MSTSAQVSLPTRPASGLAWRLVEAQHRVSTMKLVDDVEEQITLEELIDESKPPVPPECKHLHYLLFTPFRYSPRHDSRFARARSTDRAFYAAEAASTAVAEIAFHRLLFFAESPDTALPSNPLEFTAFSIRYATERSVDLTVAPLDRRTDEWARTEDYGACQALASQARGEGVELIRSRSVRDPSGGANLTLLACAAFETFHPVTRKSWSLMFRPRGVTALEAYDGRRLSFTVGDFAADSRLAALSTR